MNNKSKNTKKSPAFIIMKRELQTYFTSPTAYIVTGLFVLICGIIFFATFFLQNSADLRASFAFSVRAVNAAGSAIAISESIFLLRSIPAFLRPLMNVE